MNLLRFILGCACWLSIGLALGAERGLPTDPTELAKLDQNPIARILRLQIEENVQFGFGPENEPLNFVRIQPVFAFGLGRAWNLILRPTLPIAHHPLPRSTDGIGDIALQLFLAPRSKKALIWGLGPAFVFPTATEDSLGTKKWSAGPTGLVVFTKGPWVLGLLANQIWSFAGDDARQGVDVMTLRPILNFNFPRGWYLTSSPSIGASWKLPNDQRWLLPVGGGLGKAFAFGSHGLTTSVEAYSHLLSPAIGPDWQLRLQLTVLFPK